MGDLGGEPAEGLAAGIDDEPVAAGVAGLANTVFMASVIGSEPCRLRLARRRQWGSKKGRGSVLKAPSQCKASPARAAGMSHNGPLMSRTGSPLRHPLGPPAGMPPTGPCGRCSLPLTLRGPAPGRTAAPHRVRRRTRRDSALSDTERRTAAALMRVNHAGEIAAQALYHGQAFAARSAADPRVAARRRPRGNRPSRLVRDTPAGAAVPPQPARSALVRRLLRHRRARGRCPATGRASASSWRPSVRSRAISTSTWQRLPAADARSRAILETMRSDEIAHGTRREARRAESSLPAPVRDGS